MKTEDLVLKWTPLINKIPFYPFILLLKWTPYMPKSGNSDSKNNHEVNLINEGSICISLFWSLPLYEVV